MGHSFCFVAVKSFPCRLNALLVMRLAWIAWLLECHWDFGSVWKLRLTAMGETDVLAPNSFLQFVSRRFFASRRSVPRCSGKRQKVTVDNMGLFLLRIEPRVPPKSWSGGRDPEESVHDWTAWRANEVLRIRSGTTLPRWVRDEQTRPGPWRDLFAPSYKVGLSRSDNQDM